MWSGVTLRMRDDPNVEAMIKTMLDLWNDESKTYDEVKAAAEELASDLVRRYRP